MNPTPFTDYIEQVVGPIQAADARKDRMREELAAHLVASWEEERDRGRDVHDAAERAIRRMGDAGELSRGLADSVPRLERWLFMPLRSPVWLDALDRVMSRRKDETSMRHAIRVTTGMTAAIGAAELVVVPVSAALHARPHSDWPTILLWAIASLAVTGAGGIIFTLLGDATIRALQDARPSRMRVACYLVLSSLVAIGLGLGFVLIVSLDPHHGARFARSDGLRLMAGSLFAPPMLAQAARESVARRRRRGSWGIADIAG
jgi:hypothetical protein